MLREDEEDVFIPEENINGAFQGDEVEFLITKSPEGRRKEGKNRACGISWNDKSDWSV
mgnify:CR=1 FL=1